MVDLSPPTTTPPFSGVPKPDFNQGPDWQDDDVAEVVIEGTNEGTPWAMVHHYVIGSITDSDLAAEDLRAEWVTTILPAMAALLTDKWSAECMTVRRAGPTPRPPQFFNTGFPIVGTVATDGVPNGTALLLKKVSTLTTARGRGRTYICGLPEASTNGGLLTNAVLAAWQSVAASMLAVIVGASASWELGVYSKTTHHDLADPYTQAEWNAAFTNIFNGLDSLIVIGNLASQRDRRAKRNIFG